MATPLVGAIPLLIGLQPFLSFYVATLVANVIARNRWPEYVNDLIALVALVAMTIFTLWLNGTLEGKTAGVVDAFQVTALTLLASTMSPLDKYVSTFVTWSQQQTRVVTSPASDVKPPQAPPTA